MIERSASGGNRTYVFPKRGLQISGLLPKDSFTETLALADSPPYGSIPKIPHCSDTTHEGMQVILYLSMEFQYSQEIQSFLELDSIAAI